MRVNDSLFLGSYRNNFLFDYEYLQIEDPKQILTSPKQILALSIRTGNSESDLWTSILGNSVQIHYWCTALMWKIVKMPIADWLPYPPPLYINIGFGLSLMNSVLGCLTADKMKPRPYGPYHSMIFNWIRFIIDCYGRYQQLEIIKWFTVGTAEKTKVFLRWTYLVFFFFLIYSRSKSWSLSSELSICRQSNGLTQT